MPNPTLNSGLPPEVTHLAGPIQGTVFGVDEQGRVTSWNAPADSTELDALYEVSALYGVVSLWFHPDDLALVQP